MRRMIVVAAMAALAAGQALAQTPPEAVAPGAEALTPELFPAQETAPPVQIAALGNPPPHPIEPPLAPAPAIKPAPLTAPVAVSAMDLAQDATATEPLLDLTATPD